MRRERESILDLFRRARAIEPRVVIVHSRTPFIFSAGGQAHAFGPFASEDEARAFDERDPLDTCHKAMLLIVGPAARDIVATNDDE